MVYTTFEVGIRGGQAFLQEIRTLVLIVADHVAPAGGNGALGQVRLPVRGTGCTFHMKSYIMCGQSVKTCSPSRTENL